VIPPILLIAGAGLLILLLTGIKSATQAEHPTGGTAVPGAHGATGILTRYAAQLARYGSPMPAPALALIMYRESGGSPTALAKGAVTGSDEIGLAQLTVEVEGNAGEAQLADVDPLDPTGAIYGVQHNYSWIRERLIPWLAEHDFATVTDARDWIVLMHLGRSIGFAGTKTILSVAQGKATNPIAALRVLTTDDAREIPKIGRQTPDLVLKRLKKAIRLPDDAATLGMLPTTLAPLPERGPDVPHFDRAKTNRATGRG
jgi:hypothetical protein